MSRIMMIFGMPIIVSRVCKTHKLIAGGDFCSTALEPKIGKQTLTIHHDKHHAKYVTVANQVIIASRLALGIQNLFCM
jgi:hypothetical protein